METTQPGLDRIDSMSSRDAAENCQNSISSTETLKEQSFSAKDDKPVPNLPHNATSMDPSRRATLCSLDISGDNTSTYQPNIYAPQAQTFTYGAYENSAGKGNKYPYHFVNVEGMEAVSTGIYSDNQSLMFHTGYGYNPQMPYGPYSPATTPLPSSSGDGQLYYPQYFPSTGPYFQQPPSSNMSYIQTTFPPSQADLKMPVDKQDWLNSSDGTGSLTQWPSPAASPQPLVPVGSFGQGIMSLSSGMVSQQQTPLNAFDSSINSYNRGYFHGGIYQHGSNFGQSAHSLVNNGRSFIAIDQGGQRCKGNASISSFNEYLNEQNRGPRATRPKNANKERCLSMGSKNSDSSPGVDRELYNRPDFSIHYKVAKFFIIKSYSEDNVHKSIKYGVWASTANGNKKLDAAYHEAKENGESCPVFLFFSVNASAQFCGIAEMIGPVDFDKSVNYWQQDKWSGKFPVKWHIIKDVPNNMFRHIILESNDNKPVTNSRDTQEVKLEKGLEMLDIFKTYEADVSILDDFGFYEERQKAMQDCKTRRRQQQQQLHQSNVATPLGMVDGKHNPASRTNEFVGQISRNFAQVVRVGKFDNEGVAPDRSNSVVATSAALSEESQVSDTK